jgi:hypothetical protein
MGVRLQTQNEQSSNELAHENNLRLYNVYFIVYKAKRYVIVNLAIALSVTKRKSHLTKLF